MGRKEVLDKLHGKPDSTGLCVIRPWGIRKEPTCLQTKIRSQQLVLFMISGRFDILGIPALCYQSANARNAIFFDDVDLNLKRFFPLVSTVKCQEVTIRSKLTT